MKTMALAAMLKQLRLPTVRCCYEEEAETARREGLTHESFLGVVIGREHEARSQHRVDRLRRESNLPHGKTLAALERPRLPRRVDQQLGVLAEGHFLKRSENVLVFGNPGSGKTHLLAALGHALVDQGRAVLFTTAGLLVQDLLRAKRDLRLEKRLKQLRRYEALILDDIGYVQHDREEMEVLFALLADRYERASVLLSSNLPFSKWDTIFKDPMTATAAVDRLVHHCVILELNVKSYRLESARKRTETGEHESPATQPLAEPPAKKPAPARRPRRSQT